MKEKQHKHLSNEIAFNSSYRDLLLCLLLLILIFILLNMTLRIYLTSNSPNLGFNLVQKKWLMLTQAEQPVDWLILGDSSCNQGVIPSVLMEQAGISSLNLCTIGDMLLLNDAWMLDFYVNRFQTLKAVIIVHVYDIWHRGMNREFLSSLQYVPVDWMQLKPHIELSLKHKFMRWIINRFPLFSENKSLANIAQSAWKQRIDSGSVINKQGYSKNPTADPKAVEEDFYYHVEFVQNHSFTISSINQRALDYMIGLAEKNGFRVYLSLSPLFEDLAKHPEFKRYYSNLAQTLEAKARKHKHFIFLNQNIKTYSKQDMQNVDHVIDSMAKEYTHSLLKDIISSQP